MKLIIAAFLVILPNIAAAQLSVAADFSNFNPNKLSAAVGLSAAIGKTFNNYSIRIGAGLICYPKPGKETYTGAVPLFTQLEYMNSRRNAFAYFALKMGYQFGDIYSLNTKGGFLIDSRLGISIRTFSEVYACPFVGVGFIDTNGNGFSYTTIGISFQSPLY